MALQFIIGRAGAGKSYQMHEMMIRESMKNPEHNYVAVVPEQYSMETQKEILMQHPNHGSFNIEVTSFNRLAYGIFEEQGFCGYQIMDDLGKVLVLRRVLSDCEKDLLVYRKKAKSPGFAEKMKSVISEFKQYHITGEMLLKMREQTKSPALRHKLNDIEVIYRAFEEYNQNRRISTEDVLTILCPYIAKSDYVKNTSFYFDGFTGFTPIQYQVLELLLKYGKEVTVAVTLPPEEASFSKYVKTELFYLSKETIHKLSVLAEKNGVSTRHLIAAGAGQNPRRIADNESLCHIERHLFQGHGGKKPLKNHAVTIHSFSDPLSEAGFVASKIAELVAKESYRYNDFAIITGNMEGYYRYLEQECGRYQIPVFIDHKRNICANPFIEGIRAAIEIVEKDFSYETVVHLLKLGWLNADYEEKDLFENYVLRSGRRGFRSYAAAWKKLYRGMNEDELNRINGVREKLRQMLEPLRSGLKQKNATVLTFSKAVYSFIVSMDIQRKMAEYALKFKEKKEFSLAKEYEQTYEALIGLLEQMTGLMGEEMLSLTEYKQILVTGFETLKVGIVPPGMDTVMVGDIERTRLKDTKKILFLLGANGGVIPREEAGGSILSDHDREELETQDIVLAPTARENIFRQRLYLYSLFAKPTQQLVLCYSKSASDGGALRESYIVSTLKALFQNPEVIEEGQKKTPYQSIISEQTAKAYIAENIRDFRQGKTTGEFLELCAYLSGFKEGKHALGQIADGAFYRSKNPALSKETAKKLYERKDRLSVTKLERYAGCAYKFFLADGLKLKERERFELAAFDIGNIYHGAIDAFFHEVQKKEIHWETLSREESRKIIDSCVEQVVEDYDNDALDSTARNEFIKRQVKQTAEVTVDALISHIRAGRFQPEAYELQVEHGRLDRVDVLEEENRLYVKVIDYKSGNTTFSIRDTFFGLQLQLMIYLKDAIAYEQKKNPDREVLPAAGLYFHINNPRIEKPDYEKEIKRYREDGGGTLDEEEIIRQVVWEQKYKKYRMSGLVNSDPDVIRAMDKEALAQKGSSVILPVSGSADKIGARSNALNSGDYTKLMQHVSDLADEMQREIFEGNIPVNPVSGACDYCRFQSICGFDRKMGGKYRDLPSLTIDEVRALLNGEELLGE